MNLVLESAGGRAAGADRPRNHQYVPALRLLLTRLRDQQAVLLSALVASTRVSGLSEAERTLVKGPRKLAEVDDIEQLRLEITSAQGRVGLPTGASKEGNNRKRIQLRLDVPGYGLDDAAQLAADLAAPSAVTTGQPVKAYGLPEAKDLLDALIGVEIRTVAGRPNTVLEVRVAHVLVKTDRSPDGQVVDIGEVQRGLDKLAEHGSVRVTVDELGHRSAFVGAVLATLPGARFTGSPAEVTFDEPSGDEVAEDLHFGELDAVAKVKVRTEQAKLRKLLARGATSAVCALCGDQYPLTFLIAAHIKKRAICTDQERRDLLHVAMLACSFGCDSLYELGWVTVDQHGIVQTRSGDSFPEGIFRNRLLHLQGRGCAAHSVDSEPYFAWHRMTVFAPSDSQV
ncbi:hypothetical protein SAMN05421504_11154 [Amycolatopsis xylanica]|uniref:HNH endonuclease n=1 Tax=Amycolatopsis xylanica TaxID=589385 RepID=A0A1H3RGI1_9PSEU|nr:hypothetical protein SAMN05421504_11154 [Amycolatopsis xylanica]